MVCGPCVTKLAKRLVSNHRLDWIYAMERAAKAMARVEKRPTSNRPREVDPPDPYDYTQACVETGTCYCAFALCTSDAECKSVSSDQCVETCPAALANSHLESSTCGHVADPSGCVCNVVEGFCGVGCVCVVTGACYYACDSGYIWNGSACVPAAPVGYSYSDGLVTVQT